MIAFDQVDKDNEKQQLLFEREEELLSQARIGKKKESSQFYEKYLHNVNLLHSAIDHFKSRFFKNLQARIKDSINTDNSPCLKIALLDHTPNMEYMLLEVKYSYFTFPVSMLNINEPNQNNKIGQCYQGGFSSVYHAFLLNWQLAIKSNKITEQTFEKVFLNTIQQYIAFKIIQQFHGGPSMTNAFGFNLLIYTDSIQFSMEFCSHELRQRQKMKKDLTESMLKMHLLHIIHFDIKPENICYSYKFERYVFIDLGLHRVVEEKIGQKTLTEFRGSMLYCSKQLADCCLNGQQYVDLYYNDSECLDKTLSCIKDWEQKEMINQQESYELLQSHSFLRILVKYLAVNIDYEPQQESFLWKRIFRRLKTLQEQSAMELAYFFEMLNHTYMFNQLLHRLTVIIPALKTGFVKQKILSQNFQPNNDQYLNSIFRDRANIILSSRSNSNNYEVLNNVDMILLLKNKGQVGKVPKQTYYYLFTRFLQMNYIGLALEDTWKICEMFLAVELKRQGKTEEVHEDRLKECFTIVLKWALKQQSINSQLYSIIEQTVLSLVLLEAFDESILIDMLLKLIKMYAPPILRVRLCFYVFSCFQWVHQKYESKYNYFKMMNAVYSFTQKIIQQLKKQNLSNQEFLFVCFLDITSSRLGSDQKIYKILESLNILSNCNIYDTINSNKQKSLLQKQIILYWTYYLYKQDNQNRLFYFFFNTFVSQIIKRDLQISMRIGYYYFMYASKRMKHLNINNNTYEALSPYRHLSHFSFYRQLTIIEEMRIAKQCHHAENGIKNAVGIFSQLLKGSFNPKCLIFIDYLVTFIRHNINKISYAYQIQLNLDYSTIIKQILQIDSYPYYHQHDVIKYLAILNDFMPDLGIVAKQSRINLDLRQVYFLKIIQAINSIQCIYCKYNALIGYNQTIQLFIPDPERYDLEEHYLNLIIRLIKQDNDKASTIYQLIRQGYWLYGLDAARKTRYEYLSLLYEWAAKRQQLLPSIILVRVFQDMSIQCDLLLFAWKHRLCLLPNPYFNIIIILCNFLNGNSFLKIIRAFLYIFGGYLQVVTEYDEFFLENQDFILQYTKGSKQNRYLALYAALIMHPDYLKSAKILPRYFLFIWSKFHQLDTYSKTIINTCTFWASYIHILKVQNARQRRISCFSRKDIRAVKKSAQHSRSYVEQSNKWVNKIRKKLKKDQHKQPIDAQKYKAILSKFKLLSSCTN